MILAIDFDGVICDTPNRVKPHMGIPLLGAVESVEKLFHQGNNVVVYTARATKESAITVVEDWLRYYKIPFDEVTAIKPKADVYIDDKAIRFIDWDQTLNDIGALNEQI